MFRSPSWLQNLEWRSQLLGITVRPGRSISQPQLAELQLASSPPPHRKLPLHDCVASRGQDGPAAHVRARPGEAGTVCPLTPSTEHILSEPSQAVPGRRVLFELARTHCVEGSRLIIHRSHKNSRVDGSENVVCYLKVILTLLE